MSVRDVGSIEFHLATLLRLILQALLAAWGQCGACPRPAPCFPLSIFFVSMGPCRKGVAMRDGKRKHVDKDSIIHVEDGVERGPRRGMDDSRQHTSASGASQHKPHVALWRGPRDRRQRERIHSRLAIRELCHACPSYAFEGGTRCVRQKKAFPRVARPPRRSEMPAARIQEPESCARRRCALSCSARTGAGASMARLGPIRRLMRVPSPF